MAREQTSRPRRRQAKGQRSTAWRWGVLGVVLLAVVGLVVFLVGGGEKGLVVEFETSPRDQGLQLGEDATRPGEKIEELAADHILDGATATYNSNPPTSGAHYQYTAPWGIYASPVAIVNGRQIAIRDEHLVHNLEHGGVIIHYHPDRISGSELKQLREQVQQLATTNPRIILVPRESLDTALALTAWGYLQKLDSYDPAAVEAFYIGHITQGPECQAGFCP